MSHPGIRTLVLLAATALVAPSFAQQAAKSPPKRVAFLVGINEYRKFGFTKLKWAEADVTALAAELKRLGFDEVVVMKGSDKGASAPTRENILKRLKTVLASVRDTDIVLVALSGHGVQMNVNREDGTRHEDGFFCPVDAVSNDPNSLISISELTDRVLRPLGGKNLVLIDACRDNPDENRKRSVRTRGIEGKVVTLPEDTAILFACRATQTSEERDGLKHSVFTAGVLAALREGGEITWGSLVDRVQRQVRELNAEQEPISAGTIPFISLGSSTTNVARSGTKTARPKMTGTTPRPRESPEPDAAEEPAAHYEPVERGGVHYVVKKARIVGNRFELLLMATGGNTTLPVYFEGIKAIAEDGQWYRFPRPMAGEGIRLPKGVSAPIKLVFGPVPKEVKAFSTLELFMPGRMGNVPPPLVLCDINFGGRGEEPGQNGADEPPALSKPVVHGNVEFVVKKATITRGKFELVLTATSEGTARPLVYESVRGISEDGETYKFERPMAGGAIYLPKGWKVPIRLVFGPVPKDVSAFKVLELQQPAHMGNAPRPLVLSDVNFGND
jgi:hypothetical protein